MKSTVSNSSLPFIIGFCILMSVGSGCASRPQPYPGPETHTTSGSALPYRVDGRVYYPLNNSSGFVQQGIASWYGPDFHGKATSNGEVYNMRLYRLIPSYWSHIEKAEKALRYVSTTVDPLSATELLT